MVGPGGFATIQAAIDAAQPGDTILVGPGTYGNFTVRKGIRILGPGPQDVTVDVVRIEGLPASESLVLSGLDISDSSSLIVEDCLGTVVLHDLDADSSTFDFDYPGTALTISDCARAFVLDSYVRGGLKYGGADLPALLVQDSTVEIANCNVVANKGYDIYGSGGNGPHALNAYDSGVLVARSQLNGGYGDICYKCDGLDGNGGDGILVNGSRLQVVGGPGTQIAGGAGESPTTDNPGFAITAYSSTILFQEDVPVLGGAYGVGGLSYGPPFNFQNSSATGELVPFATVEITPKQGLIGDPGTVLCDGQPGEPVAIASALDLGALQTFGGIFGTLYLDPGSLLLGGVLLDENGQASVDFTVPPDPGLRGTVVFVQTLQLGANPALSNLAILPIVE